MSGAYGPGIYGATTVGDLSTDMRVLLVEQVVRQAGVACLREPIDDRVLEVCWDGERLTTSWLPEPEAQALLAVCGRLGASGSSDSVSAIVEGCDVLLPGLQAAVDIHVDFSGARTQALHAANLETACERLTGWIAEDPGDALESLSTGLLCLQRCLEHRVAVSIGF